jgi:hypothetical protein
MDRCSELLDPIITPTFSMLGGEMIEPGEIQPPDYEAIVAYYRDNDFSA